MTEEKEVKKRIRWDIDKVKHFVEVESGSGCKLISEEYINGRHKMEFKCRCGESFLRGFESFKNDKLYTCRDCSGNRLWNFVSIKKFVEIDSNSDCKLISEECKNVMEIIKFECACGEEFETSFNYFKGVGKYDKRQCNFCKGFKTSEKKFYDLASVDYDILSMYTKTHEKVQLRHKKCGYTWGTRPFDFISGSRCPDCAGNRQKTQKKFEEEVYNLVGEEYTVLGEYSGSKAKVSIKHNTCGNVWSPEASGFTRSAGTRCPECSGSKGEKAICNFLSASLILYKIQKKFDNCKDKYRLRFDCYINNKILVEYDGEQHFCPVDFAGRGIKWSVKNMKKYQKRDNIKNQYCIDNNIPLIRIPYWEFDNIEHILGNVLIHFNLLDKQQIESSYDKSIISNWLVDENWNQDEYIAMCPKNKKELLSQAQ